MTTLTTIVSVSITRATTTPTRVGFGIPLITAYHTVFPERYRLYTSVADMVTDGFATTSAAYLAASAVFAQTPRPSTLAVGRTANDQVMTVNITPNSADLRASYAYKVYHNGVEAKYTTDATPTVAEICAGLAGALDPSAWSGTTAYAVGDHVTNDTAPVKIYICTSAGTSAAAGGPTGTGSGITDGTVTWNYVGPKSSITATDNTTYVSVAADTVPDKFRLYGVNADYDLLHFADVTADGTPNGIVADLTAIRAQYDDFYAILPTNQGKAVLSALAAGVEAMSPNKTMICSSPDNETYDSTSTTDIAATLQTAGYDRTMYTYHYKANTQFPCAAWAGRCLPEDPGSITWAFKSLSSVDVMKLSDTHTTALEGKDANYYVSISGVSITLNGEVSGNEFYDIIRGTDALEQRMKEYVFTQLANDGKIPYTNNGIARVEARVRQALKEFTVDEANPERLLTNNPAPEVFVPDVSAISDANKGLRILPDITFTANYAGAVHRVQITGTISL